MGVVLLICCVVVSMNVVVLFLIVVVLLWLTPRVESINGRVYMKEWALKDAWGVPWALLENYLLLLTQPSPKSRLCTTIAYNEKKKPHPTRCITSRI